MVKNVINRHYLKHKEVYDQAAIGVLESGWYVTGKALAKFESEFGQYLGTKHCIGLANGLDALWIGMKALGIQAGDEVIVQSNTYIATVMGITINGATPVFVEPDECFNMDPALIEAKITSKTKAILVTHLYGQATNMTPIVELKNKYNLLLIEDCAQSHGAKHQNHMTGNFGDLGCFSFYPTKNLGCFGDGGAVCTPHDDIAKAIRVYRNYGSEKRYYNQVVGINSRLDELQAALLSVKLPYLDELNKERSLIAQRYLTEIRNPFVKLPKLQEGSSHTWHQFVILSDARDQLMAYLEKKDIQTIIHYPIPPHLSEAYEYLGYKLGDFPLAENYANQVLSLPMFDGITDEEVSEVILAINQFEGL